LRAAAGGRSVLQPPRCTRSGGQRHHDDHGPDNVHRASFSIIGGL
jgi:hypothetical protein